jgi:hypothetical protein
MKNLKKKWGRDPQEQGAKTLLPVLLAPCSCPPSSEGRDHKITSFTPVRKSNSRKGNSHCWLGMGVHTWLTGILLGVGTPNVAQPWAFLLPTCGIHACGLV